MSSGEVQKWAIDGGDVESDAKNQSIDSLDTNVTTVVEKQQTESIDKEKD